MKTENTSPAVASLVVIGSEGQFSKSSEQAATIKIPQEAAGISLDPMASAFQEWLYESGRAAEEHNLQDPSTDLV